MNNSKYLNTRYDSFVCQLCKSKDEACRDICKMTSSLYTKVLNNPLNFRPGPSGELKSQARKEIRQLELIHEIKPRLRQVTTEFRGRFEKWSKFRLEVIEELTIFIGQVVKVKTWTNVAKACGQVTGITGGILAIGGLLLAPETGGLSLTVWGSRVSLAARRIMIGANITDGVFSHLQSKRVAALLEKDLKMTEQMEDAVLSLMTTSQLFSEVVDEFQRHNQWFNELKSWSAKAKTVLGGVEALTSGLFEKSSKLGRGREGFLTGIYIIIDLVDLVKTLGDIRDGSRSDLQEHIMALTAVLVREHDMLQKQYGSLSGQA